MTILQIIKSFRKIFKPNYTLENDNSQEITLEKIINDNNKIVTKDGFCPDLIIANNDFTDGPNPILQNITQTIIQFNIN